ncbi:hypothetical protein PVNG_06230 [Plasmodium vivax North Korean]|uniref:Uncharacterized protein n=1 Tax=Plasmodium vivax North Korean TaxID=1035514 RepID=A0A0J9TKX3_PLAVI|nr:hypothetical protein PVNG_06230 [Plasmodium vivax North Korean]
MYIKFNLINYNFIYFLIKILIFFMDIILYKSIINYLIILPKEKYIHKCLHKKGMYGFFENINRYIKDGKSIELTRPVESAEGCSSFSERWSNEPDNKKIAKNICDNLVRLYKYLSNEKADYKSDINYEKDLAYIRYWVNWKIYKGNFKDNISVSFFYDLVESHALGKLNNYIYINIINNINENELNKMNILYNLFEKYSELKSIVDTNLEHGKHSLLPLSTACCTHYIKANYICNGDNKNNNPKFCDKLVTFESQYEQLYNEVLQKGSDYYKNFIKLSECPNNKIITTAVTGTVVGLIPLLGVLYKVK